VATGNCYKYQYVIADYATNTAIYTSANEVMVDVLSPSGGSIDYANGYYNILSVPITYTLGTDAESGINSSTAEIERAVATLSGGICSGWSAYTTLVVEYDGSYTDTSVSSGHCYSYVYVVYDNAGNPASYFSAGNHIAKVDTDGPVFIITAPTHISSTTISNTTIHVSNNALIAANVIVDPSTTAGTSTYNCVQTNTSTVDCTIDITSSGDLTIKATDDAGNISIVTESGYIIETTSPAGGSITYADGEYTTAAVPVTYTLGTDSESGISSSTGKIQRASATLTNGVCGVYGSFADLVTEYDGSYTDTSVSSGNCYKYRYVIADNAGNVTTYTSINEAKVSVPATAPIVYGVAIPVQKTPLSDKYPNCSARCEDLDYDVYIVNPNGTERHMNDARYARISYLSDGTVVVNFEDKGVDNNYRDVIVRINKKDCHNVTVTALTSRTASWHHQIKVKIYQGGVLKNDVLLWPDSHLASEEPVKFDVLGYVCQSGVVQVQLPAQTRICSPYLLKYIKFGAANDPAEVKKLKIFLRDFESISDLDNSGIYDRVAFKDVVVFQERYASDILTPWGATAGTGYVYRTTLKKINELYCAKR
jgi:hypothetical protein